MKSLNDTSLLKIITNMPNTITNGKKYKYNVLKKQHPETTKLIKPILPKKESLRRCMQQYKKHNYLRPRSLEKKDKIIINYKKNKRQEKEN